MYEATKLEAKVLNGKHNLTNGDIKYLDALSERVRKGITIGFDDALVVANYQGILQSIRKMNKKWWKFWQ